eukprot:scaffold10631_cov20-Tisochrysis_lutea.AAC.2
MGPASSPAAAGAALLQAPNPIKHWKLPLHGQGGAAFPPAVGLPAAVPLQSGGVYVCVNAVSHLLHAGSLVCMYVCACAGVGVGVGVCVLVCVCCLAPPECSGVCVCVLAFVFRLCSACRSHARPPDDPAALK